jgi:sulfite exporter TauE/SafE
MTLAGQAAGLVALAAVILLISPRLNFSLHALDSSLGYGALFAVGLVTSVHCIGMCGGINMAQCISYKQKHPDSGVTRPSLIYNSFRVLSYTAVGALAGTLGSAFNISGNFKGFVSLAAGLLMIVMGFNLLGMMGALRRFVPRLPSMDVASRTSRISPAAVGILNGFMPCGPLQAMQLYALSTGSPLQGALAMLFFGIGTFPVMFAFGSVSTMLSGKFTRQLLKVSGVLVIILGVIAFDRGLGLVNGGGNSPISPGGSTQGAPTELTVREGSAIAVMQDGFQEVRVNVWPRGYQPFVIQKDVPVRLTFIVEQGNLNGCNNAIVIPSLELEQRLAVGETIMEFAAGETGEFRYICWMNMIRSTFLVVPDLAAVTP